MNKSNFYQAMSFAANFMLVIGLVLAVVVGLTGCQVNVIVANGATFAVDSLNTSDNSANMAVQDADL